MVINKRTVQLGRWCPQYFIGNHPAFDFANTLSHRLDPGQCEERLETLADLAFWASWCGLVDGAFAIQGGTDSEAAKNILARSRSLREAGHKAFHNRSEKLPPDTDAFNTIFDAARGLSLGASWTKPANIASATAAPGDWDSLLCIISLQILDALFRLPAERIRACPACGWFFHDTTRGGRRRWCRMETCGNRTKARRHRDKQSPVSDPRNLPDHKAERK